MLNSQFAICNLNARRVPDGCPRLQRPIRQQILGRKPHPAGTVDPSLIAALLESRVGKGKGEGKGKEEGNGEGKGCGKGRAISVHTSDETMAAEGAEGSEESEGAGDDDRSPYEASDDGNDDDGDDDDGDNKGKGKSKGKDKEGIASAPTALEGGHVRYHHPLCHSD